MVYLHSSNDGTVRALILDTYGVITKRGTWAIDGFEREPPNPDSSVWDKITDKIAHIYQEGKECHVDHVRVSPDFALHLVLGKILTDEYFRESIETSNQVVFRGIPFETPNGQKSMSLVVEGNRQTFLDVDFAIMDAYGRSL